MPALSINVVKTLKACGWVIALGSLGGQALAAEPSTKGKLRGVEQAISVIGLEVRNSQDETLGRVKDLALDLENGRIVEVIVSSGPFSSMGQRTTAVPPGAFQFDQADGLLRLKMDREKFKGAPGFDMTRLAEYSQSHQVAEVYRYFGQKPYFASDGQPSESGNTAFEPLGYVERSSKIVGLPVQNLQLEPLGRVSTFLYNLAGGRVLHVIVTAPGVAQTKRVIPARALRFGDTHDALFFDVASHAFNNEPRFQWTAPDMKSSEHQEIYSNYQQETYANSKVAANHGVNTRQNVQAGSATTYSPLAQGSSFADVDKTRRIYAAMRAETTLSPNAQNVEVGTLNGRITLRGHVNTEEGKRAIGRIAATAGRPENVSNLLEVRPAKP